MKYRVVTSDEVLTVDAHEVQTHDGAIFFIWGQEIILALNKESWLSVEKENCKEITGKNPKLEVVAPSSM